MKGDLRWVAKRMSKDPNFLGYAISAYQKAHALDDDCLLMILECTPKALTRLRLCGMPIAELITNETQKIADFAPCNAKALLAIALETVTCTPTCA